MSCLYLLAGLLAVSVGVSAIPRRGNEPWSMVLCKFKGIDYEPRTAQWFREWLVGGANNDTIENYFSSVSNDVYTINGSNVTEWLQLPWTRREILRMALLDPRLQSSRERPFAIFDKAKQLCISFAQQNGYILHKRIITVINSEQTAIYGKETGVLITPKLIFSSVLAHEMIHSLNIGHSYSDRPIRVFPYSGVGEYDDHFDLMSTANAHMKTSTYGYAGPGLNSPHLDYLGWLPMNRIVYFGRDGRQNYTLRLSSLSLPHSETNGWLMVVIPYDRDDPSNVFTVEYRTPHANDAAIAHPSIVIHRIQRSGMSYYSQLITHANGEFDELTLGTEWIRFLKMDMHGKFQFIRLKVERERRATHSVDIRISSTFRPDVCLQEDTVVKLNEDMKLKTRGVRTVCLEQNRTVTADDIDVQYARDAFYELRRTFGQNECVNGKEWRAIDAYDYVCVDRKRVQNVRSNVLGDIDKCGQCAEDTVPRMAFQDDKACVDSEESVRIQKENSENHKHLRNYAFFNGADPIGP